MIEQRACFAFAAFLSLLLAGPAPAQNIAVPPGRWVIDYADARCSLARRSADAGSPIMVLGTFLGGEGPQVVLIADRDQPLPRNMPDRVEIVLLPSGARTAARVVHRPLRVGGSVVLQGLPEGFVEQFGTASQLRIDRQGRALFRIDLPNSRDAVAALKTCNDDLLRTWGVDIDGRARLSREAKWREGITLLSDNDYPPEAIRRGEQGTAVMRLAVGPNGRALDCDIVESSGSPRLDQQSCALVLQRGRFEPALDLQGQPTATSVVRRVTWRLPE